MQSGTDVAELASRRPGGEPSAPRGGVAGEPYPEPVELTFAGEIWFWRGPAPWHFLTVPDDESDAIEAVAAIVTYGWGMIPVTVRIGDSEWATSLWPKDGGYIVPIKAWVRAAERLEVGDAVEVRVTVAVRPPA